MKYIALFMAAFGFSCSDFHDKCDGNWTYDVSEWDEDELFELGRIELAWNNFAKREVVNIRPRTNANKDMCQLNKKQEKEYPEDYAGVYKGKTGDICIRTEHMKETATPGGYLSDFRAILLHEVGHGLGLRHVEGEGSIMYYKLNDKSPMWFSSEDRYECISVGICEPNKFEW